MALHLFHGFGPLLTANFGALKEAFVFVTGQELCLAHYGIARALEQSLGSKDGCCSHACTTNCRKPVPGLPATQCSVGGVRRAECCGNQAECRAHACVDVLFPWRHFTLVKERTRDDLFVLLEHLFHLAHGGWVIRCSGGFLECVQCLAAAADLR